MDMFNVIDFCLLISGQIHSWMYRRNKARVETGEPISQSKCCEQAHVCKYTRVIVASNDIMKLCKLVCSQNATQLNMSFVVT